MVVNAFNSYSYSYQDNINCNKDNRVQNSDKAVLIISSVKDSACFKIKQSRDDLYLGNVDSVLVVIKTPDVFAVI